MGNFLITLGLGERAGITAKKSLRSKQHERGLRGRERGGIVASRAVQVGCQSEQASYLYSSQQDQSLLPRP